MRKNFGESPRFSQEEETVLYRRMRNGDQAARDLLARSVLPWALTCAMRLRNKGIGDDDLEELAIFSVAEALERWDPGRGRLTTAVPWTVWSGFSRQRALLQGASRVPVHLAGKLPEALKHGAQQEHFDDAQKMLRPAHSLSRQVRHDIKQTFGDGLPDKRSSGLPPDAELIRREELAILRSRYHRAIQQMTRPRDRQILQLRWEEELTLEEVAARLNITREHVRQLQTRAEKEFRQLLKAEPESSKELTMSFDGEDTNGCGLTSRLPTNDRTDSLLGLLGQKSATDINREIATLDAAFEKVEENYRRQKDMLLVLRKALSKRDGVSLTPDAGVGRGRGRWGDSAEKSAHRNTVYSYLVSHPGVSIGEIISATGLTRTTVNTTLQNGKKTVFRNRSRGMWEAVPPNERTE